jgi:hypothetical protein
VPGGDGDVEVAEVVLRHVGFGPERPPHQALAVSMSR